MTRNFSVVYPLVPSQPLRFPLRLGGNRLSLQKLPRPPHPHLWGLGLGSFALGLVNGALVISAGVGLVIYSQLLALSPAEWQALRQRVQQTLPLPQSRSHQALLLSILLAAGTYTVTGLGHGTESLTTTVGQLALTLLVIGLLLRSATSAKGTTQLPPSLANPLGAAEPDFLDLSDALDCPDANGSLDELEQPLAQLSHGEPLQRLVAVRQLVRLVEQGMGEQLYLVESGVSVRSHLLDCFHIMLAHEPEPIVRTAVREGLGILRSPEPSQPPLPLPQGPPPFTAGEPALAIVAETRAETGTDTSRQGHRIAVEYVEYLES